MLKLYSAEVCPFAQRTRALLMHLAIPFARREVDLSNKSADFVAISPTGKVPLLVDGKTVLYESSIINEYLADTYGWKQALPATPAGRARVRLAMKQLDDVILPTFYGGLQSWGRARKLAAVPNAAKVDAELAVIEQIFEEHVPARASLTAFHFGPFWLRIDAVRELTELAAAFDQHPGLRDRLAETTKLEAVRTTAPTAEQLLAAYRGYAVELAQKAAAG